MERLSDKFKVVIFHVSFFFLLLIVYLSYIVVIFDYEGFVDNFNVMKVWLAVPAILILASTVRKSGSPSNFFLHMTLTLIVSPTMVLYCGSDLPDEFALLTLCSFILILLFAYIAKVNPVRFINVSSDGLPKWIFLLSVLLVLSIFALGGGKYLNFDLSQVYDLREDAAKNLPGIYGYLTSIFAKVIIPFGIVFALLNKRWWLILLLTGCSFMIFALTAHKAPIFFPLFVCGIYWITGRKNISTTFLLTVISLLIISEIDFWLAEDSDNLIYGWVGTFFADRVFLTPSLLDWFYFDFFSDHPSYYWSQSKITLGLSNMPYPMVAEKLIGQVYMSSTDSASPNIGWIGSGFANAKYLGTFIYSVLIGCFLSFLDVYARKLGSRVVIALFTVPFVTMITSSDLPVIMLTDGLIIAILLLMSINPKQNELTPKANSKFGVKNQGGLLK